MSRPLAARTPIAAALDLGAGSSAYRTDSVAYWWKPSIRKTGVSGSSGGSRTKSLTTPLRLASSARCSIRSGATSRSSAASATHRFSTWRVVTVTVGTVSESGLPDACTKPTTAPSSSAT